MLCGLPERLLLIIVSFIQLYNTSYTTNDINGGEEKEIHFGAFISNLLKDDLCYKAAIEAAVQMVNEDQTILKGYRVKMNFLDNYGMTGFGISEFFKIHKMKNVLQLLLGPFTEKHAAPVRELSYNMKLPMFEDNGETYESQRKAIIALLKHFQWERVSMMYDFQYLDFVQAARNLKKALLKESIRTISVQGFSSSPHSNTRIQMSHLKRQNSRIIILDSEKSAVPTIFCDAYLKNMSFPTNVYISSSIKELDNNWHLKLPDNMGRCTPAQISSTAEGFILLRRSDFRLNQNPHRAKKSRSEIWNLIKYYKKKSWLLYLKSDRRWRSKHSKQWPSPKYDKGAARVFDLVYRAALAFDGLLKKYGPKEILMSSYYDRKKYERINNAIEKVEFDGISGKQRNIEFGYEIDHIIYQYRNGSFVKIGYYTPSTDQIFFLKNRNLFPGHRIPYDGVRLKQVFLKYNTSILIVMWIAACFGILLSSCFLTINLYYRKKRIIKMSSPNVNNIIIFGCILCYVSILLRGIDMYRVSGARRNILCYAMICTLSVGFTLSYGGLFSKTWRVFRIFAAARTNRRVAVRDGQLYLIILLLVLIDACILTGFMYAFPFKLKATEISRMLDVTKDTTSVYMQHQCHCQNQLSFLLTLIAYKAVLLTFGLFMAWETRKVSIPVLNDSKHIGIAVYIITVVSAVGAISATALSNTLHFEESYVVIGLSICVCTTATLLLVFYPKIALIFDKSGRDRTQSSSSIISSSSSQDNNTRTSKQNRKASQKYLLGYARTQRKSFRRHGNNRFNATNRSIRV